MRWLGVVCAVLWAWAVQAMVVEVQGHQAFASGAVEGADYLKLKEALNTPGVDTLVLVNSRGGDLWAGMQVSRMVSDKGLHTVVAGFCNSACSVMFMGGKERRFSDAFRPRSTFVGIHGAHQTFFKTLSPRSNPQIFALFKSQMGDKFLSNLINTALYDMDDPGSMLYVYEGQRNPKAVTVHCRSSKLPRSECTQYPEVSAYSMGLITSTELVSLTLPVHMVDPPKAWGRELATESLVDLPPLMAELAQRHCLTDSCKTRASGFSGLADHRAIAARLAGPGIGWSYDRESPDNAIVVAIYGCNHFKAAAVGLCEARAVNGWDLRPYYQRAEEEHAQALRTLSPPQERYYANEELGGAAYAGTYRTRDFGDLTPRAIEGVSTIGTQELAQRIVARPLAQVLLDVGVGFETLPSARALRAGGMAYADPSKDAALHSRFAQLLALLAPDKSQPLVIFADNRERWTAVNAVLRARAEGYAQVLWYRGGLQAWKSADLPTALNMPQAVAD